MSPSPDRLERFTRGERWTHRAVAALVGVLLATAAFLYFPPLASIVGFRELFKFAHVTAGYLLPLPVVIALGSAAFRHDLGRLNRFTRDDWHWFRKSRRNGGDLAVGKFNAGQKLHAAVEGGALIVLFGTGMVMYWSGVFSDDLKTGATFVHDWVALATAVLITGHIAKAYQDPTALAGMRSGFVPVDWAVSHHPDWTEDDAEAGPAGRS